MYYRVASVMFVMLRIDSVRITAEKVVDCE